MDKRRKTRWEKKMRRLNIILAISVPLVFGVAFWLIARRNQIGH